MKSYYLQEADQITPIFGVDSVEEAKSFVEPAKHHLIVATHDSVYMGIHSGRVDFESGWDDFDKKVDSGELVEVAYSTTEETWVQLD